MNKIKRSLVVVIATAFALTAFAAAPAQAAKDPAKGDYTLSVEMQTGQIRLLPDDIIVVSLQNNPTTGYSVSAKITGKKKAVKLSKGFYAATPNPSGMVGSGGVTNWGLEALKPGVATMVVTMTAPSGKVEQTFKLKVFVTAK
ncbi:MAG: protease inhibitor I42 family protein [Candidatus Nanopelagicales bacterium]|jgi:predicted secreted protein